MLLWSIQHKRAYEKMEQTGVLRADKNFKTSIGYYQRFFFRPL